MKRIATLVVVFFLGAVTGFFAHQRWQSHAPADASAAASGGTETALQHAKRHLEPGYVCPMHPQVESAQPGKCPLCGMALVPREESEDAEAMEASGVTVELSPAVINQLGVRTATVRRGDITRRIETSGYSIQIFPEPVQPAYQPQDQLIAQAASPEGVKRKPSVVLVAQVFERQAPLVKPGQKAQVRLPGLGAQVWDGTVLDVDPQVTLASRTVQVRVKVDTGGELLKPGTDARVAIEVEPVKDVLLIPREALIVDEASARVIVALGEGRFEPREVITGEGGNAEVAVRSGLKEGEKVVTSSQFLLDSEASLQAGLRRLAHDQAEGPGEPAQEAAR